MAGELARLVDLFEQAERLIEREMLAAFTRGAGRTAVERDERLRLVQAILARLRGESTAPTREFIEAAYAEGSQETLDDLRKAGEDLITDDAAVSSAFGRLHIEAIQALFESLDEAIDRAILLIGRRTDDIFRQVTLNELLLEQISGRTRTKTTKAMEERLIALGVDPALKAVGNFRLPTYVAMAARTTGAEAHTRATLNRMAEQGFDLVKVSKHPHPHDVCSKYEDKVYSISGLTEGYPELEEAPPFHPNCKHVLMPYVAGLREAPEPEPPEDDDPFAESTPEELGFTEEFEQQVREYEESVIREMEQSETSRLAGIIRAQGGIRSTATAGLQEEYRNIPNTFKRKDGIPGDQMAEHFATYYPEFGIETENDLLDFFADRYGPGSQRAA